MSKKELTQGLSGLLSATQQDQPAPGRKRKVYESVCWNLHPNDVENVKKIAKYEGRKINDVVTEALRMYFKNWKPTPQEKPTLL